MDRATSSQSSSNKANGKRVSTTSDMADAAKEQLSLAGSSVAKSARECGVHFVAEPAKDIFGLLRDYSKAKPDIAAMWCFGIGLVVGWKLRR